MTLFMRLPISLSSMSRRHFTIAAFVGLVALLMLGFYTLSEKRLTPLFSQSGGNGVERGVVLLTGVTYERLSVFAGVDHFYTKMWRNRLGYARTHGIHPLQKSIS
jgi:hypothetical protein